MDLLVTARVNQRMRSEREREKNIEDYLFAEQSERVCKNNNNNDDEGEREGKKKGAVNLVFQHTRHTVQKFLTPNLFFS